MTRILPTSLYRHGCVFIVAATALLLAGCTTMESTSPYEPLQVGLANTPRPTLIQPAADATLTIEQAIAIAQSNNPTLESIRLAVAKANAAAAQAKASRSPTLDAVGSAGRYSDAQRVAPPTTNGEAGVFSRNLVGAELVLSYPLYTGGTLKANEAAARFGANASRLQYLRAKAEIGYNVARVFAQILAQRQAIASLQFNRKSLSSHLKRIKDLVNAQKAAAIDRLRVEVRIADLQQKLTRAENDLELSRQILANLMGLNDARFKIAGELKAPANTQAPDLSALLHQSEHSRSDLAAMTEQLKAQAKRVDAVLGETKPKVSAFAAYGERWGVDPDDDPAGADSDNDSGRIGLSITFPIWDGKLRKAKIETQKAELAALQKRHAALKQRIALEIRTAVLNLQSARKRAAAAGKAVDQASEVLRIQKETQGLGKATLTDVLDAQSALLTAQTNHYAAMAECRIAEAELKLALGRRMEKSL